MLEAHDLHRARLLRGDAVDVVHAREAPAPEHARGEPARLAHGGDADVVALDDGPVAFGWAAGYLGLRPLLLAMLGGDADLLRGRAGV